MEVKKNDDTNGVIKKSKPKFKPSKIKKKSNEGKTDIQKPKLTKDEATTNKLIESIKNNKDSSKSEAIDQNKIENNLSTEKLEKKRAKKLAKKLKKVQEKQEKEQTKKHLKKNDPKNKEKLGSNERLSELDIDNPQLALATIFVGNLPVNTKRVQISRLFSKFGKVKAIRFRTAGGQVIFKHKQRKTAGALNAYVVFGSKNEAEAALALNGTEFKGTHVLRVNISGTDVKDVKRTIFVGNLKYSANEDKLREIFLSCGDIDYVRCLRDGDKGCKGVAYVCFKSPEAVGLALELNETSLDDRPIHVERYSVKKLGAKNVRDQDSSNKGSQFSGAKKRIMDKNSGNNRLPKNKKKSEYRGVRASGIDKKKPKTKMSAEKVKLVKKIAPKAK